DVAAWRYTATERSLARPNLLPRRPVEMYGCVLASTSGLTRRLIGARRPSATATDDSAINSESLSTLKQRTPAVSARRISSTVLPTPENTTRDGSAPIASTRL